MPSILIITNRAPWPLKDGGALAMHQLIQGYKEQGWVVHLLCMNTGRHFIDEVELRQHYAILDSVTSVPYDNRLRPGKMLRNLLLSRLPEHAERFWSVGFETALLNVVRRMKPEVIQLESVFLTEYLTSLRRVTSSPVVLRMHNVEYQIWSRAARSAMGAKRHYLRILSRRMKRYEEWAWSQYDLLLPITKEDGETVTQSGCTTPLHYTPFGLQLASTKPLVHPGLFNRFYHIGAMDWLPNREGVSWFIQDVWKNVQHLAPDAQFHFAGRNLESNFNFPLPSGVFNHGTVSDSSSFLSDKGILVVPLRAGGGIRVKILEAMAAGKLVISTSVGIQGIEAVADTHFLLAETADEWIDTIKMIFEQREKAFKIAGAGQQLVQNVYDANAIITGLSHCMRLLIGGSS